MVKFTPEEIEEMRRADEKIERDFRWTRDELAASRSRDAEATIFQKDTRCRSIAEYQKAYYEANKDSIAEYQKAYREANKDSIAEYQRAYREANKGSIAEYQKAYYEANKDSIAEYHRAYREANKGSIAEYQKAYYEANKDSIAEKHRAYYEANKDSIAEKQRWIREARLARGFSQRRLAMEIGVNQPSISLLESGGLKLDSFRAKHALFAALGAK